MPQFPYKFCLITDFRFIHDTKLDYILSSAIKGGVDLIQYRDKGTPENIRIKRAEQIKKITGDNGAGLIINGSVDLAVHVKAEGVQFSREPRSFVEARKKLGPERLIGASVHNRDEVLSATERKADFLILSPFFTPGSKNLSLHPLGAERFSSLCALTHLPVIALGGITKKTAHIPLCHGAHGVACITGLLESHDIYKTAKKMAEAVL